MSWLKLSKAGTRFSRVDVLPFHGSSKRCAAPRRAVRLVAPRRGGVLGCLVCSMFVVEYEDFLWWAVKTFMAQAMLSLPLTILGSMEYGWRRSTTLWISLWSCKLQLWSWTQVKFRYDAMNFCQIQLGIWVAQRFSLVGREDSHGSSDALLAAYYTG